LLWYKYYTQAFFLLTHMFQTKKAAAPVTAVKKSSGNKFLSGATKISSVTTSGNGAVKYTTSGSPFVDQLASAGLWIKPRTFAEAASDQSILWGENPSMLFDSSDTSVQ
jgi:hypothetical protein